jgi:hypothetical protein
MSAKETAKKVIGFLVFKSVMTGRNLSSLALVVFFFGVYWAAGGRISSLPVVEADARRFGGAKSDAGDLTGDVAGSTSEKYGRLADELERSASTERARLDQSSDIEPASKAAEDDRKNVAARPAEEDEVEPVKPAKTATSRKTASEAPSTEERSHVSDLSELRERLNRLDRKRGEEDSNP